MMSLGFNGLDRMIAITTEIDVADIFCRVKITGPSMISHHSPD